MENERIITAQFTTADLHFTFHNDYADLIRQKLKDAKCVISYDGTSADNCDSEKYTDYTVHCYMNDINDVIHIIKELEYTMSKMEEI